MSLVVVKVSLKTHHSPQVMVKTGDCWAITCGPQAVHIQLEGEVWLAMGVAGRCG